VPPVAVQCLNAEVRPSQGRELCEPAAGQPGRHLRSRTKRHVRRERPRSRAGASRRSCGGPCHPRGSSKPDRLYECSSLGLSSADVNGLLPPPSRYNRSPKALVSFRAREASLLSANSDAGADGRASLHWLRWLTITVNEPYPTSLAQGKRPGRTAAFCAAPWPGRHRAPLPMACMPTMSLRYAVKAPSAFGGTHENCCAGVPGLPDHCAWLARPDFRITRDKLGDWLADLYVRRGSNWRGCEHWQIQRTTVDDR